MALLRTENLDVEFIGSGSPVSILKGINISVPRHSITTIIGESGGGKSTLGRTISALLPPEMNIKEGLIYFEDLPVSYKELERKRGDKIFYAPQGAASSFDPVKRMKSQLMEKVSASDAQLMEVMQWLRFKREEIESILNGYPFQLSGGENQRCLLAYAIVRQGVLTILDEPTAGFDEELQEEVVRLLKFYREEKGYTFLIITHSIELTRKVSDYIYIIQNGEIVDEGSWEKLVSSPAHPYTEEITRMNY